MKLKCNHCGNEALFDAQARAQALVSIDGSGNLVNKDNVSDRRLQDVIIIKAVICRACGASGTVVDLDAEED